MTRFIPSPVFGFVRSSYFVSAFCPFRLSILAGCVMLAVPSVVYAEDLANLEAETAVFVVDLGEDGGDENDGDLVVADATDTKALMLENAKSVVEMVDLQKTEQSNDQSNQIENLAKIGIQDPPSVVIDPNTHLAVRGAYAVYPDDFLSLEQAQTLLMQVSPKVFANQSAVVASQWQAQATQSLDDPLVFAGVSATAYHLNKQVDLGEVKSGLVEGLNAFEDKILANLPIPITNPSWQVGNAVSDMLPDEWTLDRKGSGQSARVGMIYPLYTAGRIGAIQDLMDAKVDEAVADAGLDADALYTQLVKRYFTAQLAIIVAYLRSDAEDTFAETDHLASRLFEEGFISYVDRLQAQSALADAKSEAIKANNDARLAMMALQRLLRTPFRVKPITPLFVSSQPLPELQYFQNLAFSNHPILQKIAAKKQQAEDLHRLSDNAYKPTVSLFGVSQMGRKDDKPSWVAGISASWRLWGGLDKQASLQASQAKIRQAELTDIETRDNLLLLIEKNWHEVNNAQARYQALQSNIDLAQKVLHGRQLGLQEGLNTTLDVISAQTQYLKARTEQAQAANAYIQALAELMQSCGTPLAFNQYMQNADIHLPTLYQKTDQKNHKSDSTKNNPKNTP